MPQRPLGASFDYVITPAGPADAEALANVHVTAWRETYAGMLPDAYLARMSEEAHARRFRRGLMRVESQQLVLAAMTPEGIVGYASGGTSRRDIKNEAEVFSLYVLKSAQGRGVGRRLFMSTARALAWRGARSLVVSVLRENEGARGFYEELGGRGLAPRQTAGPGGQIWEVDYLWPQIGRLLSQG